MDVAGGLVLAVLALPLALLLAAAVALTSRGPVLFWQKRVGKGGQHFWFPKFRTMVCNAEELKASLLDLNHHRDDILFKVHDDPRVTPLGKFLRRASLDELPQLWCVLKGDMSLVGPRPPLPEEVARYSPEHLRRLEGLPGLTCLWQVSGRSDLPFATQVTLDVAYLENADLWLDLRILAWTLPAVASGRGAY